jgi:hypothetical protein
MYIQRSSTRTQHCTQTIAGSCCDEQQQQRQQQPSTKRVEGSMHALAACLCARAVRWRTCARLMRYNGTYIRSFLGTYWCGLSNCNAALAHCDLLFAAPRTALINWTAIAIALGHVRLVHSCGGGDSPTPVLRRAVVSPQREALAASAAMQYRIFIL